MEFAPPADHAGTGGGVGLPRIFRRETFPLTCAFCFAVLDEGSSGKSDFDNFGGGPWGVLRPEDAFAARGSGIMVRCVEEACAGVGPVAGGTLDAEVPTHGVLRWP